MSQRVDAHSRLGRKEETPLSTCVKIQANIHGKFRPRFRSAQRCLGAPARRASGAGFVAVPKQPGWGQRLAVTDQTRETLCKKVGLGP